MCLRYLKKCIEMNAVNLKKSYNQVLTPRKKNRRTEGSKQNGRKKRIYIACSISNRYPRLDWILSSFVCLERTRT